VSPDGRLLVGLDRANAPQRWDLRDGRALGPLTGLRGEPLGRVAFTPDGRTILATDRLNTFVGRFDAQTGAFEGALVEGAAGGIDLAFSRDGAEVALAVGAGPVRRFGLRDWREIPPLPAVTDVGDATSLAAAGDGSWVLRRGGVLARVHPGESAPRWRVDGLVWDAPVALSPDDRVVAVGGAGAIRRYDAATGARLPAHGHGGPVTGLRALTDGAMVSSADAWPRELLRWRGDGDDPAALALEEGVRSLALSPDGARVAFVDREQTLRLAPLDDIVARDPAVALAHVRRAFVLLDGRVLFERASGPFVFDPATRREARCGEPWESVAAVSADGALAALRGRKLVVRRTTDGVAVCAVAHPAPIADAAFTGDGAALVTLSHGDGLRVWDVATGAARAKILRVRTAAFARTRLARLAVTSDGGFALVGDEAGNLHGADLATHRARWIGPAHRGGVTVVELDEASGVARTAGGDTTILTWELAALRARTTPPRRKSRAG
jgi:WD40 repeat protein